MNFRKYIDHAPPYDSQQGNVEGLEKIFERALRLRQKYMKLAHQSFPSLTRRFINPDGPNSNSTEIEEWGKY